MPVNTSRALFESTCTAIAVAVLGLMAAFFSTYSYNVNLAMLQVDGAAYATVPSLLNQNVRHAAFWLLSAAAAIYVLGILVFTRQVNLPMNAVTEARQPSQLPGAAGPGYHCR